MKLAFSLLAVAAVLAFLGWVARTRLKSYQDARQWADRFFVEANSLIKDERIPEPLARVFLAMASTVSSGIVPYAIAMPPFSWIARRVRPPEGDPLDKLDELPRDIREAIARFAVTGLLTISYQSVFAGPRIRRRIFVDDSDDCEDHHDPRQGALEPTDEAATREYLRRAAAFGIRHGHRMA